MTGLIAAVLLPIATGLLYLLRGKRPLCVPVPWLPSNFAAMAVLPGVILRNRPALPDSVIEHERVHFAQQTYGLLFWPMMLLYFFVKSVRGELEAEAYGANVRLELANSKLDFLLPADRQQVETNLVGRYADLILDKYDWVGVGELPLRHELIALIRESSNDPQF